MNDNETETVGSLVFPDESLVEPLSNGRVADWNRRNWNTLNVNMKSFVCTRAATEFCKNSYLAIRLFVFVMHSW